MSTVKSRDVVLKTVRALLSNQLVRIDQLGVSYPFTEAELSPLRNNVHEISTLLNVLSAHHDYEREGELKAAEQVDKPKGARK